MRHRPFASIILTVIHSTCVPMLGGKLVEGPFGPRIMKDSGNPSSACQDSQAGRPFICRAGEAELVQIAVQRPDLRAKADAKQQHIRRHIARQFWQRATR
jgi:hypothetical protein